MCVCFLLIPLILSPLSPSPSFLPGQHPSPCRRPPLLWQLCQCKLLQSVWSGLGPGRAVPAGLPISYKYVQEPRITNLQVHPFWTLPSLFHLFTLESSGYYIVCCYFIDLNPLHLTLQKQYDVFWVGEMLSGYIFIWPKTATIRCVNKVVWCFDFLHYMTDLVTYFPYGTLFTRWFLHLEIWPISCFKWAPSGFIY